MSFPDPFINASPLWQPYSGPPDADLAQPDRLAADFFDFVRAQRPAPKPTPQLPRGVTLNQRNDGEWVLVYPGSGGFRSMTGSYDELMKIVERME